MTIHPPSPVHGSRLLIAALLFTIVAHGLGMLSMAGCLLPGVPGGFHASIADRAGYVAGHPWLWRVGWAGWQLTAFSDLVLAVALIFTRWIPKTPAVIALVATLAGMLPDQSSQFEWTWQGVMVAADAVRSGQFQNYLDYETARFYDVAVLGTAGYLTAALAWTWCFAAAGTWSKRLTYLSIATWGIFALSTALILLPDSQRQRFSKATGAGNGIAFVLLMIWLIEVTSRVWRRATSPGTFGPTSTT